MTKLVPYCPIAHLTQLLCWLIIASQCLIIHTLWKQITRKQFIYFSELVCLLEVSPTCFLQTLDFLQQVEQKPSDTIFQLYSCRFWVHFSYIKLLRKLNKYGNIAFIFTLGCHINNRTIYCVRSIMPSICSHW